MGSAYSLSYRTLPTQIGRRRIVLWGGVRADNPRAVHFYRKMGFVEQGQFATKDTNNYDMLLDPQRPRYTFRARVISRLPGGPAEIRRESPPRAGRA